MMETVRSFIAIEIPEVLRQKLRDFLRDLKNTGADVKWIRPDAIHLTLKFLGAVEQDLLERVSLSLGPVVEKFVPFELRAEGAGFFPSFRKPRVVWAGLIDEEGTVSRLQREIEMTTAGLGFPSEDRPFKPHLTLGRVRSPKGKNPLTEIIEGNSDLELGSFRVERVVLFRSDLRPEGAVYTKLQEFFLKGI
ncbi:MAG: 2-5 ligase [Deltaproteobacteria bacterium]|nr:2-5 ligase [Deltaproteobacteria bacterium]